MTETAAPITTDQRLPFPTVFAFVGSGALLVLEIVAGRLLAPTLGVSLYTWTSVIGVVLAGVSLGNYFGGKLADRRPSRSVLAAIYAAGAATSALILGIVPYVDQLQLPDGAPAVLQVLWLNVLLFLLPATILGAATPLITRLALDAVDHTGRVVGRIQASAALGSIFGTFLTGYFLISWIGTRRIVAGVAIALLLLAALCRPRWLAWGTPVIALAIAGVGVAGWASKAPCTKESDYYCIQVKVSSDSLVKVLKLDSLVHSYVFVPDPSQLVYDYEQLYAGSVAYLYGAGARLDSLFLGGGGYTFPRYLRAHYRGNITVAEIDPAVTQIAHSKLLLDNSPQIHTINKDARQVLRSMPPGKKFDLVLGDAFNDFEVPYQLTTREFNNLLANHLKPNGTYLLNVIDAEHFDFLRSEIRTLRLTFPYVGLIAQAGTLPPGNRVRSTFVVVARRTAPKRPFPVAVSAATLDRFMRGGRSVVLTDDYAPTDQLLAPVFAQALAER
jgi:MFS family permease